MKRGIVIAVLALTLALAANATHTPTITIEPTYLYETQESWFNLSINNFASLDTITQVNATLPGFTITEITNFSGWKHTSTTSSIRWYDGTIETNILNAMFQFKARAPVVTANQTYNWIIDTEDDNGGSNLVIMPITLVNDITGPLLTNPIPNNGTYVKQGSTTQPISIDASDPETGIKTGTFHYDYCTGTYNISIPLTCTTSCSSTMDTTSMTEGQYICYRFEVENNAGEKTYYDGKFGLDGTPPTITLIRPVNNEYVSDTVDFSFKADDNLAASMTCNLTLDNTVIYSANVLNGEIQSTTINISNYAEGSYNWDVTCADLAGWETTSATRTIILDKTAPTITLISPANNSIIASGTMITVNITDNYAVDSTWITIPLNTSTWPDGFNTITIYANDSAGNLNSESFSFIIDKTAPQITLTAPANNTSIDAHVNFTFTATDNYDNGINCSLYIDSLITYSTLTNNNTVTIIPQVLSLDQHNWFIICEDDAGNSDTTQSRTVNIIDLSPPDITIQPVDYVKRGDTLTISATITDPSNISTVTAQIGTTQIILIKDNNRYYGYYPTNINTTLGTKTITYTANDTLGNVNSATEDFDLIANYIFTTSLTPNPATQQASVTLGGTVVFDNNSNIPENLATIILPDNTTTTSINATGYFKHTFTAPNSAGTYDITASITTSNNITYNNTNVLTVTAPGGGSSSSGVLGSGGSGGGSYCGDGLCGYKEDCTTCSTDCGQCPEPDKIQPTEEAQEIITPPEPEEETPEADERTPIGVGSAVGWFSNIKNIGSIGAVFLLAIILTMAFAGNKKDKFKWDEYFKR